MAREYECTTCHWVHKYALAADWCCSPIQDAYDDDDDHMRSVN